MTSLIGNGGFEVGPEDDPARGYTIEDAINGWSSLNGLNFERHTEGFGRGDPSEGQYWLDLDESPGNLDIVSAPVQINLGETYIVAFSLSDSNSLPDNGVEVYLGNQLIDVIDASEVIDGGGFQEFAYTVTANFSGPAGLRFVGFGNADNQGLGLDLVSLRFVEPAAGSTVGSPGTVIPSVVVSDGNGGTVIGSNGSVIGSVVGDEIRIMKLKPKEQISGFDSELDQIFLNDRAFKELVKGTPDGTPLKKGMFVANDSGEATKNFAQIIYNEDNGKLFYDSDGKGDERAIHFATFTDRAFVSRSDFEII